MSLYDDSQKIVRRNVERHCFCRGCDKKMNPGEEAIYTYSFRNRGQHIFFCLDCADEISNLVKNDV